MMPKISIYVSDELKARMDAADERANWSAVAQRAFDVELNHLEAIKKVASMTDVIERLRASKSKSAANSYEDGKTTGREWAMKHAEYQELKSVHHLSQFVDAIRMSGDSEALHMVAQAIIGDPVKTDEVLASPEHVAEFLGIEPDMVAVTLTADWLTGFVEGAEDVWSEVADQL